MNNKIILCGIRKKDLRNLDYYGLKAAFYGLHNLDIPIEILNNENPDEIAAKYIAAYILKRNNNHLRKPFSTKTNYDLFDDSPVEFNEVIRRMDDCAYRYLRDLKENCVKKFSANSGDQLRRLGSLEDSVKRSFMDSFFKIYRPSMVEQPDNVAAFYDPNCDGRNGSVYINRIYEILKNKA